MEEGVVVHFCYYFCVVWAGEAAWVKKDEFAVGDPTGANRTQERDQVKKLTHGNNCRFWRPEQASVKIVRQWCWNPRGSKKDCVFPSSHSPP